MSAFHIRRGKKAFLALGPISACLFDLDGLLASSELISKAVWHAIFSALCSDREIPIREWLIFNGVPKAGKRELGIRIFGDEKLFIQAEALRDRVMLDVILGFPLPVKLGAVELLEMLGKRRIPRVVVTAAPEHEAWAKLSNMNLDTLIDGLITGDSGSNKVELYKAGAIEASVDISQCLAFEDSPKGGLSALAAGAGLVVVRDLDPLDAFASLLSAPRFAGFYDSIQKITEILREVLDEQLAQAS